MLVGWALLFGSPWLVLGPVSFVAFTTQFQILPEERVMRARFGEAYAA
jgi:protein-S-isoprenylcysteine O-methyltransferase Ste14